MSLMVPKKTMLRSMLRSSHHHFVLKTTKINGYSGRDLRIALIETCKLFQTMIDVNEELKTLLTTAVKISEILYSQDDKRTLKSILQLYNCTWLHYELCKQFFCSPREVSYENFFGIYIHSLVVHAPIQYKIVCLTSINTENEERLFQQAKRIARLTTNRHPEHVIPSILLRLQLN